jgi:hypothetical protein
LRDFEGIDWSGLPFRPLPLSQCGNLPARHPPSRTLPLAAPEDKLLLLGGFSGRELGDCHAFDIAAGKWACPAAPAGGADGAAPAGCAGCAGAIPPRSVFGAAAHACGGGRGGAGCGHGGHVLLYGGEVDPSTQGHAGAGGFSAEVLCLDPKSRACHALAPAPDVASSAAPGPRGWFGAAAAGAGAGGGGAAVVVFGGVDADNRRLDDVWVLQHA